MYPVMETFGIVCVCGYFNFRPVAEVVGLWGATKLHTIPVVNHYSGRVIHWDMEKQLPSNNG